MKKPSPKTFSAVFEPAKKTSSSTGSTGFRIVARYCYPKIQSAKTFTSKEEAKAELKRWKKEAEDQGQHIIGRIVKEND